MSAVAELLSNPQRWLRKGYAQDANGRECKPTSSKVRKWSLLAAIRACYSDDDVLPTQRKIRVELHRRGWYLPICHWNEAEKRKHKEVVELARRCGV